MRKGALGHNQTFYDIDCYSITKEDFENKWKKNSGFYCHYPSIILHCMPKQLWKQYNSEEFFGQEFLEQLSFIPCSSVENFWRIAPFFQEKAENFVLLCIDPALLTVPIC